MRKLPLICFASILATSLAHATALPCNGFEIKIKNETADDFLVNKVQLEGAQIQPGAMQKINAHSEEVFTVNNSVEGKEMNGNFEIHTISLPSKKVLIKFDLKNKQLFCEHTDQENSGDYTVNKTRLPNHVTYTIK